MCAIRQDRYVGWRNVREQKTGPGVRPGASTRIPEKEGAALIGSRRMIHSARGALMRASVLEFRLRMAINTAIIVLGFWAPWIEWWGIGRRISLVEWLALELSRSGKMSFAVA